MTTNTVARLAFWLCGLLCFGCGWVNLGNDQAIGRPCTLPVLTGASQGTYSADSAQCPSKVCLKPVVQSGASGIVDTEPTCSGECSQDSDCDGEVRDMSNPADTRCAKGFTCGVPFIKGPLCCKKMCMCRDFLGPAGAPTPLACQGEAAKTCDAMAGASAPGVAVDVEEVTDAYPSVTPARKLDLVTMVSNGPTMGPKIAKLNDQFPRFIEALRDPVDGSLPDLRLAIIDSDLGTGGIYTSGPCGPKTIADGTVSPFGDLGRFQMRSSPVACPFNPGALFLEQKQGGATSFAGDIGTVFSCLTSNLGTNGCWDGHQLQAFEFALSAQGVGNEAQQAAFLRSDATLGLLIVSDEDDCSAAVNDGMFGDKHELRGESATLRCATRGHMCAGANLSTSGPGYPTTAAFTHPYADCQARTDACPFSPPTDTSMPTSCSPLRSVAELTAEMLALKSDPGQVFVAGILGWPRTVDEMTAAAYKIAPVPNPNAADTQHPTVFDLWPVCYDPNHLPTPATTDPVTGFDATAAGWGAKGGLRLANFIDGFGENSLKFSICEPDFAVALTNIGWALAHKLQNLCFEAKLLDTDPVTPGIQPDCRVTYLMPNSTGGYLTYLESPTALAQCPPGTITDNASADCWLISTDTTECPRTGQRITIVRTAQEVKDHPQLDPGTKLKMECRTCPTLTSPAQLASGCDY